MAHLSTRDAGGGGLSGTAIVAIVAGVGGVLLCGIIVPVILLIRARRQHNRFIADLEKRGIYLAQARDEAEESVARPRNVLRRNTGLPFDGKSGWGALQSSETLQPGGTSSMVEHYVPPKPLHSSKRLNRLSWPFSKRISGHSVQMQKLKGSRLSTVMEDPKQSPLVPILGNPNNQSRLSIVTSADDVSAMSSCQSLLRHHPALRSTEQVATGTGQAEERSYFRGDANKRLIRARSMAAVSSVPDVRPLLRARSASSCQISGKAPDVILPPLPSDIERIKSDEDLTQSRLRHALSKSSVSSVESADTTILASRLSPIIPRATKARTQRITKPTPGPRPFRDTLDLRAKVVGTQENLHNDPARSKSTPQLHTNPPGSPRRGDRPGHMITESNSNSQRPNTASSDIGPYPNASPMRFESNQRRRSKTYVSCAGSPERNGRHGNKPRNHVNGMRSPKRQHSQTSSRSSGGNPFQWDQPLSPTMKPSALKGSPGARQGSHHRKNSVRISLVPTFHGPPSRGPSSSLLVNPQPPQDGTENTVASAPGTGLGLTSGTPSAAPFDSSTSAQIPQNATTTVQASLTDTSPTLPLVAYDDTFVVFPTDQVLPGLSPRERKRLSNGSVFGLSQFPATPSVIEPVDPDLPPLPQSLSIHSLLNNDEPQVPGTPHLKQQPFDGHNSESEHSEASVTETDGYDPNRPSLVFQTPSQPGSRIFQSVCTPIEEESSIASIKTATMERVNGDNTTHTSSNPSSPPKFDLRSPPSYAAATAPELPETINPAMLCKDAFPILNSSVDNIGGSTSHASDVSNSNSISRPQEFRASRQSLLGWGLNEPITSAALAAYTGESPVLGHNRQVSQASSVYSNPSPQAGMSPTASPIALPSPVMPCSPRPAHAQLPDHRLSINFAELPKLDPSPRGPRGSPPRPLRSSIAALRRMNSDCADAKNGKLDRGERRYLRIGREESVQLPGDESWLEDLSEDNSHVSINDLEGRRLVGSVLDDWDEGGTMISLGASTITQASMDPTTAQRTSDLYVLNTTAGAEESSSSVWEDSEIFWSSNTPPPPQSLINNGMEYRGGKGDGRESEVGIGAEEGESTLGSPNKPKQSYQPLASSPLITSMTSLSTPTTTPTRKRRSGFTVAMDSPSAPVSPNENIRSDKSRRYESGTSTRRESGTSATGSPSSRRRSRGRDHSPQGRRHRKRNVLGVGTPNVRIQVTSPSGSFVGGEFTPGSVLYDSQGFLRY